MLTSKANFKRGEIIADRFRIKGALSWGAYALIYEAERLEDGSEVALKVLRATAEESDPAATDRFLREAEAAKRLSHPNVVQVLDWGRTASGIWYIAMERLFGHPLQDVMYRVPVPPEHVRQILHQILAALAVAHDQGLVHRDLKPANVFLCEPEADSDEEYRVKLLDFGFLKGLWGDTAMTEQLTNDTDQVGTPGYMAPEMLTGEGMMSPQVDLYAVGLIGWEMLAAEKAFKGEGMKRLYAQLTSDPVPSDLAILDLPVFDIIAKLIARDRADRYHSAVEALHDLEQLA